MGEIVEESDDSLGNLFFPAPLNHRLAPGAALSWDLNIISDSIL